MIPLRPEEWEAGNRPQASQDSAPSVGSRAPQAKARWLDSDREIDLSTVQKITVLVFGSHT